MDDLISRQAAIDAINHICPVDTEYDCTLLDRVDVRCVLSDLPSAQPEIIRCKDCKYYREYGYVNGKPKFLPKCGFNSIYVNADDFCSRAERREE